MSRNPNPRLSREQSQFQTRQLLLDAARTTITENGIASATVRGISEAAGFSQGAFYSNFANKEALLIELMNEQMQGLATGFTETLRKSARQELGQALAAIAQWLQSLHSDAGATLMLELQIHANQNPTFGANFGRHKSRHVEAFADGIVQLTERYGRRPRLSPMQMAVGFMALSNGFGIQRTDNYPVSSGEVYLALLRALFDEN